MARSSRDAAAGAATVTVAEAATRLGVEVDVLIDALRESGVAVGDVGNLRLLAAEVESFGVMVAAGRRKARDALAALVDEV